MGRGTHKATFTTEGSLSRSTSRERSMDEARTRAGERTGSFSAGSGSGDVRIHIPRISEENLIIEPEDTEDEEAPFVRGRERDVQQLDAPTGLRGSPRRLSSAYGTFAPSHRFLQLNGPENAGLKRNESVFKVRLRPQVGRK